jgi:hypothetical protein
MVGNVSEWVADWVPQSTACGNWGLSDDIQCLAGAGVSGAPGALIRGGNLLDGAGAGVFAVNALNTPFLSHGTVGFRSAR